MYDRSLQIEHVDHRDLNYLTPNNEFLRTVLMSTPYKFHEAEKKRYTRYLFIYAELNSRDNERT